MNDDEENCWAEAEARWEAEAYYHQYSLHHDLYMLQTEPSYKWMGADV
jgi:hypothetical protein